MATTKPRTFTAALCVMLAGPVLIASIAVTAQQSRDAAATKAPTGSAVLTGTVTSATDPAVPIRRAIVTLAGAGLGIDRSVITNDDGSFTFDRLPSGSFTVTASRTSYLPASFGAKRPARPGTPIAITAGQHVTGISLRLSKGGVIAGTIRSSSGLPVPGLQVVAMRAGQPPPPLGLPSSVSLDAILTDDRGAYRLYGLEPGSYVVVALVTSTQLSEMHRRSEAELDAAFRDAQQKGAAPAPPATPMPVFAPAPIYYPGTAVAAQAAPIDIAPASMHDDVSFTVDPVPSSAIDGVVQRPTSGALQLIISGDGSNTPLALAMAPRLFTPPGPDGKFRYTNVTPGHYTITALMTDAPAPSGSAGSGRAGGGVSIPVSPPSGQVPNVWWASTEIDVNGSDVSGVTLVLQPGMTVSGRVQFDATSAKPPADLTKLRISISPIAPGGTAAVNGTAYGGAQRNVQAFLREDGSFDLVGLTPGQYRVFLNLGTATGVEGFWPRSAMVDDRDLLDTLVTIAPNRNLDHVVLTMTDRHSELSGQLETPAGRPAADYYVIALPAEHDWWKPNARRIRSTRPATDGRFVFTDLPGGSYVLAAVDDLEPSDLNDPKFIEALSRAGIPVTLSDGEKKQQNVRLR